MTVYINWHELRQQDNKTTKITTYQAAHSCVQPKNTSMTQLLMRSVAHSTRPSFRPKTNNQSIKKFLSLAVSLSKSRQKLDVILENEVV